MRIGGRLMLLLAVPLVGLLVVTGYGVVSGVQQAREASGLQQRTELALTSYRLIDDLQVERSALVDREVTSSATRAAVAANADAIRTRAAAIGGDIRQAADRALVRVDAAERIAAIGLGGRAAMGSHSPAIDHLLVLATLSIDPAGTIDGAPAETANNLARTQAASAQERDLVVVVSEENDLSARTFQELTSLASAQRSYADLAMETAVPAMAVQVERVGHGIDGADAIRRDVFSTSGERSYTAWVAGLEARTSDLARLQGDASTLAVQAVDDLATSSRTLLVLAALAAIATILITVLLLRRAIRSIARPLEELATQAEDVARVRLPEAVRSQQLDPSQSLHLPALKASGAAEVFEVAAAFNDVQDTALRLASEQAALRVNQSEALTNLGRRNQTLLARQLDFISSLETKETDPIFLEHLFKLDHLASRMRRNAESLLILAGSETPRRRRAPAQVSEVVRAAMSEVEEFERVRIGHLRDATLTGPIVIDLIHLLAEIIENALGFSPPDTTVEIGGRSLGQGGYQFAVIDHGVGMSDVELVAANQRLGGLDELEGMPTRYLGQYVVAKLAAKTGVMARLQPSSGGRGVTALITLPTTSVLGAPDRPTISTPVPGSKASREQGPAPFAPGAGVAPAAASIDLPSVIEASVVPDLRDRPDRFERPVVEQAEPAALMEPEIDRTDPDRPADNVPFDGEAYAETLASDVDRFDASTFDMREYDEPAVEQDVPGRGSFDTPEYDRTTFDRAPLDPAGDTDTDQWEQFSHNMFDTPAEVIEAGEVEESATTRLDPDRFDELSPVDFFADRIHDGADVDRVRAEGNAVGAPPSDAPPVDAAATAFAESPFADTAFAQAAFAQSPPPAPGDIPVQPDWSPFTDPPASPAFASSFAAPAPSTNAATSLNGSAPSGGLARRIPGASLAESRQPGPSDAPREKVDRSADGVRSMLSSFQAGRSRGQAGSDAPAYPAGDESDTSDSSQDGRSTR